MKNLHEYEIKIRTEKHGVYVDHGPFSISAKDKQSAYNKAMRHLRIRLSRLFSTSDRSKVAALKSVAEDTIASETSVIITRTR